MNETFNTYIQTLDAISLQEMDAVSLMKRTDTKFVIPFSILTSVLQRIGTYYKILEINENRIMTYSSMYFDTPNSKFYNDHHNGKSNRTKIRIRNYVESDLFFLEIKQKNGKGVTNKSRIEVGGFEPNLSKVASEFIHDKTAENFELKPALVNEFKRVTLVNIASKERVTIDLGLKFTQDGRVTKFKDLVVIELKQERYNRNSAVVKSLKHFGYKPYSVSKYCIGIVSLYKGIKYNSFKKKIRTINKIISA